MDCGSDDLLPREWTTYSFANPRNTVCHFHLRYLRMSGLNDIWELLSVVNSATLEDVVLLNVHASVFEGSSFRVI